MSRTATETAARPEGAKACKRCGGKGWDHWHGPRRDVGRCFRCSGYGFTLANDALIAHVANVAAKARDEAETSAIVLIDRLGATESNARNEPGRLLKWRSVEKAEARLLRAARRWESLCSTSERLAGLVGTGPNRAAIRQAAGDGFDSSCR